MDKEQRRAFVLALLLGFLAARALRAFVSSLAWESLVTFRVNASAFWFLLLLLPVLVPRRFAWHVAVLAVLASAAMPLARLTPSYVPVAGVAAAASLGALLRLPFAGAAVGVALQAAFLVAASSHDPTLGLAGGIALGLAGAAALVFARQAPTVPAGRALDGLAVALVLALELAWLANPFGLARWTALPAWVVALASLVGLIVGETRFRHAGALALALGALGAVELALVRSPLAPVSILLLQVAVGNVAARLRPHPLVAAPAIAGVALLAAYFEQPYGTRDWGGVLPAVALLVLALGATRPRMPPAPRLEGALPTALVAALVLLSAFPPAVAQSDPDGDGALRVVSWNVRQGFGNRGAIDLVLYASVLRDLEPDVVVLQESGPPAISSAGVDVPTALARELRMHHSAGAAGVAVLSRFPIVEERPRGALWSHEVALDVDGTTLWVAGVHLGRSTTIRHEQAREILDAMEARPGPRIVAGDMNSCPSGAPCFGFNAQCSANGTCTARPGDGTYEIIDGGLEDAWVLAGNAATDPAGNTHHVTAPRRRIDQVWVHEVEVLEARPLVDGRTVHGSDHAPVLAVVRLRA